MSADPNLPMTKADRRLAKREEAARIQAETEARERRSRRILWGIIAASIAGLIGLGVWQFTHAAQGSGEAVRFDPVPVSEVANVPANTNPDGGIVVDQALAATTTENPDLPTVAIYLDYHCSWCAIFEQTNFDALVELAQSGAANVVMHPVAILDGHSTTTFSTRSAAAAAWVADRSPDAFMRFHDLMFRNQPASNSAGLSNAEIADLAREAGASESTAAGIADGTAATTFGQWTTAVTREAAANPELLNAQQRFGTPTIIINGHRWDGDFQVPGALREAVLAG